MSAAQGGRAAARPPDHLRRDRHLKGMSRELSFRSLTPPSSLRETAFSQARAVPELGRLAVNTRSGRTGGMPESTRRSGCKPSACATASTPISRTRGLPPGGHQRRHRPTSRRGGPPTDPAMARGRHRSAEGDRRPARPRRATGRPRPAHAGGKGPMTAVPIPILRGRGRHSACSRHTRAANSSTVPPPISSPCSVKRWREIGGPSGAQAALCVLRTHGIPSSV